ncbi:Flocculation suppression protein [Coemansia aciculifera]|uniref:Flocculation suppression protein n=1 Tax=Coemansia aciculifera TaxID=417176 RepID=A0A9W8IPN4_9FUNG|nr:Flocculation suppression protein [Coemansia aciculifera]
MNTNTSDSPTSPPPAEELAGGSKPRLVIQRTHAAFVSKLYAMVADGNTDQLISWTADGDCFKVTDPAEFARIVLPAYFKHGNWPSFVRQLNMYGFHKINDLAYGGIFGDTQLWMFKHPHFQRGELGQLQCIKRRGPKATPADAAAAGSAGASGSRSATPSSPAVPIGCHPAVTTGACAEHERAATPEASLETAAASPAIQSTGDYVCDLKNCISELQQSNGQLRRENQEMRTAVQSCQSAFAGIMGFLEATIVQPCLRSDSPPDSRGTGTDVVRAFQRLAGELAPLIAHRDYPPSSSPNPHPSSDYFPLAARRAAAPALSSFRASPAGLCLHPALPPIRLGHGSQPDFSPRLPSLSPPSQANTLANSATDPSMARKRRSSSGSDANTNSTSSSRCSETAEDPALSPGSRIIVLPPISGIVDSIPSPQHLSPKATTASNHWHQSFSTPHHQSSLRETFACKRSRQDD